MKLIRFDHFASQNPDALAVIEASGKRWTRGQLAEAVNKLSRALRTQGVVPGDVLAIIVPNCAEYMIAYLAATQIGMYVVPVNWHLAPPEIQYILEDCRATAVFTHERFGSVMQSMLGGMKFRPRIRISTRAIPEFTSLEEFSDGHDGSSLSDPVRGRALCYTSATTGKPKGVSLSLADAERVFEASINSRVSTGTLPEEHVLLLGSMLYHGAPLEGVAVSLHLGHIVVLTDRISPESVLQLIDQYRVTLAYLAPSMFVRLLALDEGVRSRYSTSSLRRVVHTGATCPVEVKRRMIDWWGPILWEPYGAAEGAGTIVGSVDWLKYPGTVGRPMPGTRLKIIGENDEELPPGQVGTIYLTRYSGDRFEYLRDPEKTRATYRGDFFTVGDVGYLNEEGYLFLCDRKIDMINLSGMKVYSAEIESVLILHPHVADCAVFGVPDALTGEAIMAVIQPAATAPALRELKAAVTQFLGEHLSVVKIPRFIELVPELARDATGKLQKRHLRERFRPGAHAAPAAAT
jgi:long-chain acyl-CoA synthetase